MLLSYHYNNQIYKVLIHWTADTGNSTVFQEIVQRISDKHQLVSEDLDECASNLDALTDRLYEQLYIFSDEHSGTPYNPCFRRIVMQTLSEICTIVNQCFEADASKDGNPVFGLFVTIVDKLQEIIDVYLADNAYQGKHRYRRVHFEQYCETTEEITLCPHFTSVGQVYTTY